jgi:hypothetical protein
MGAWPWFAIAVGAAGVAWIVRAAAITAVRLLVRVVRADARREVTR